MTSLMWRLDCTGRHFSLLTPNALSAAYAIACTADKIVLPRTAEVGSVGVVAVHVGESGADAQAGLAYTYIHAGTRKVDGNPHEPLSPDVKSRLQADVDVLYEDFVALVARRRKCSPEFIRATEAAVFRGQDAVNSGLADAVGTFQQAHDRLAAHLQKQPSRTFHLITATPEASMSTVPSFETTPAPVNLPDAERPDADALIAKAEASLCARFSALSDIATQAIQIVPNQYGRLNRHRLLASASFYHAVHFGKN